MSFLHLANWHILPHGPIFCGGCIISLRSCKTYGCMSSTGTRTWQKEAEAGPKVLGLDKGRNRRRRGAEQKSSAEGMGGHALGGCFLIALYHSWPKLKTGWRGDERPKNFQVIILALLCRYPLSFRRTFFPSGLGLNWYNYIGINHVLEPRSKVSVSHVNVRHILLLTWFSPMNTSESTKRCPPQLCVFCFLKNKR